MGLWMKSEFDGTRGGFISIWVVEATCSGVGDGVGGGGKGGMGGLGGEAYTYKGGGCLVCVEIKEFFRRQDFKSIYRKNPNLHLEKSQYEAL